MRHKSIEIFLFVDALGWKIVNDHDFLADLLPHRRRIQMQFGYSSSAIPTILSGRTPAEHGHLGMFRFAPEDSPFRGISRYAWLFRPRRFWDRGRVRHHLSRILKRRFGFTGYFQLYRMPIEKLRFMDYCEKQDLFLPGGMAPLENLADLLLQSRVRFHISNWRLSDEENFRAAERALADGRRFLFIYTAGLDGFLHEHIKNTTAVGRKLQETAARTIQLYEQAGKYADQVNFTIFSDHGMTPLTGTVNLMEAIESQGVVFGRDYGACFDSTMARFYFLTGRGRETVSAVLETFRDCGHTLSREEEIKYGIYRSDRLFGDRLFLLNPGLQMIPSDMASQPLPGMHGFSPEDIHSHAALLSNTPIPEIVQRVADYFHLMRERALAL